MPAPLSPATVALIKATVPALEAHGLTITKRMYERLFQNAEIRDLFNQSHHGETGSQPKALAQAVLAYARNIDNLGVLGSAVERIAQKHVALNILPEHYPHVADALLGAIGDVLGAAATPEICAAWGEAYWFLAEILIGREAAIYRDLAAKPGGWNGWRDFHVENVVQESETIRSFVLVPVDGAPVLRHEPGQYLGFLFDLPGHGVLKRNYSISCAPNDRAYRITVKREAHPGAPAGIVSNWLHDHARYGTVLRAAPPAGDFFLDRASEAPVVLVSGGVGLTPMLSMLAAIEAEAPGRPTWYVHGALNGRVHAMRGAASAAASGNANIRVRTFYAQPEAQDRQGEHYDEAGLITAGWLVANTPQAEATYYLCGPKPFLASLVNGLRRTGVPDERVRFEFFGPADELAEDDARLAA
ncbi:MULTISPECIES: NO-inducible flavohemoprotein [Methylobacterium]|uniref:Flavohemoprotein n=2 Tax=Methylobacterium TaxID=407 RepID=A0A089NTL6_9HYPH|nr:MULTISPECIES: NO-inducible flavohemoprotein [Methylobacterium]ACB24583.1 globin [Methylobacterium radiotolerans JCM 2831]AIQ90762.1 Nitric oxide dioxygenase [Methylobacterium oryzae CBMB20]GEN00898.1 flavohemoprotein [Methylobacterium radiotolerans]